MSTYLWACLRTRGGRAKLQPVRRRGTLALAVNGQPTGINVVKATPHLTGKPEGNTSMVVERMKRISTYSSVIQLSVYG
jgi:hypothetical protein